MRVHPFQPTFHGAVEDHSSGRRQRASICRELLFDLPDDLALGGVPGNEPAPVAARTREHAHDRADVGLAYGVFHFDALVVHADVVGWDVEEAGLRRERRRLLVLVADRRRADPGRIFLGGGAVLRVAHRHAGRQVDLRRPVHARTEVLCHEHLAGGAVECVTEPVAIEVDQRLGLLPVDVEVGEDHLVDAVVIPLVVRRHLVRPARHPRVGIAREDGHRPLVVAGALIRVPGARVAGAVIEEVQLGVVGVPAPGRPTAALPLFALPGGDAQILTLVRGVVGDEVRADLHLRVGAGAVGAPDLLTAVDVERRHATPDTELTAGNSGDDDVLDHDGGVGHGRAFLVVGILHPPQLLAGLRVEGEQITGEELDEELAARVIGEPPVDHVAAGHRDGFRRLCRRVLPQHRRARLGEVERVDGVGEGGVHVHHVADHQRVAFMSAQGAGGEGPGRHHGADVRRSDLIERAESLQIVGAASHRPLALLIGCRSDRDERDRHCGDSPGSPTANHFDNRHLRTPSF